MSIAVSDGSLQINGIRPEGENQLTRQLFQDYTNDAFKEPRKEKEKADCENDDENGEQSIASTSKRSIIESNGLHYTIHQISTDIQPPCELGPSESSPKNDRNEDSDDAQMFSSLDFMLLNNNLNELLQQQLNQELQRDTGSPNSVNIRTSPSPWMRNAGRKKSHPVWNFFRDLKGVEGTTGGVMCLHCEWTGDDRSPNNLRTHLKRCHMIDGIYQRFSAKLAVVSVFADTFLKRCLSPNFFYFLVK
ncbi:unnamed protein product, partial [Mesorhabditis belari]|uniref:BED-type domain-containing protein n=1 Tax=Mesorhabditis belari TaxID=2138241 RepID=A0AAF3J1C3_9BILA